MMDFGWKKKAERLRMIILSVGHQGARSLSPGLSKILELFRYTALTGDDSMLQEEMAKLPPDEDKLLWEPIVVHGWKIEATMYLQGGQLWWLAHTQRPTSKAPSDKNVVILNKALDHLGADPKRDMIIGPSSSPDGEPALAFGWWTWFNRSDLYEIQLKGSGSKTVLRTVPLGTPTSDGYTRVDLARNPQS